MLDNETDEEIIAQYKNGDREIFRKLINRYTSPLYNFVVRLVGPKEVPDILQEIYIKVWKNIGRFDPQKASFKTWIFSIAKNTTTDFLRKKRNILFSSMEKEDDEEPGSFEEKIQDENLLPDEALQKLQDSQFLNKTIEKIKPIYREILMLHYQEEMTFEEIGMVLDKPLNTVKSQHRRALIELRKMIN